MKKRLFQRISEISFWKLYLIIILFIAWDCIFTYLSLKNRPGVRESNPFHVFWLNIFGIKYFLFLIPIAIIILYIGIRIGGKLLFKKNKKINPENHIALIMILAMAPNIINQLSHILFNTSITKLGFKLFYPLTIAIIVLYILWMDFEIKQRY